MATKKTETKDTTVEVDGISVTVALDPANDYEIIACSTVLNDPSRSVEEQNRAFVRRVELILGDDYRRVLDELRAAHDGKVEPATLAAFVRDVTTKVAEAKNS